LLLLYWGAEC